METNGKISVLKKEMKSSATKQDVNATYTQPQFPTSIIMDGNILGKNLRDLGLSKDWLYSQLKIKGIETSEAVFYAEIQKDGSIFIDEYKDNVKGRLF